ncbi:hypothetical protein [Sphingomonas sp. RS2018]
MQAELFDDRAHRVVAELLDAAEGRLIRTGQCSVANVSDYLTLAYIKEAAGLLEYGTVYLEGDGRNAADIFMSKLAFGAVATKYRRNSRRYARHLQQNERIYFPNMPNLLRLAYLNLIQSDHELDRLMRSGLILLAARTLPGVAIDIRREFRRRGLEYDRTLFVEPKKEQPKLRTMRVRRLK